MSNALFHPNKSLATILNEWKSKGLEPREVIPEDVMQSISITHDPLKGELHWDVKRLDGMGAMGMMLDAAVSMFNYFTQGKGRTTLETGNVAVMLAYQDGQLKIIADPPDNDIAIKRLLAAVLLYYISKGAKQPLEQWHDFFKWDVTA